MAIQEKIKKEISVVLKSELDYSIKAEEIVIERPQDEEHGDFSANIALTIAKDIKKSPREIAQTIADKLTKSKIEEIANVEIAGPGFINFKLKESHYFTALNNVLEQNDKYGQNDLLKNKRIMVEFAHPNPFKSFHIGHLRNIILGESIVRMLESQGAEVIRTNYQGDVGMHIAKCIWAFQKIDPKDYPSTADEKTKLLGKCYAEGATAFEEDEKAQKEIKDINKKIYTKKDPQISKLWDIGKKWSLEKFHEIYARVYSTFEREYMESETLSTCMKYIQQAKEKGILKQSQGALIFDGEKYNLDTRVFLNAQGLPTYEGKELGLAYMEFTDYGDIDLCIHNVAVEQISFFKVTFKVEELLDPIKFKGKQYHNAYEFVGLKKGKMSSRKGNVILGDDILNEAHAKILKLISDRKEIKDKDMTAEEIGIGAVKWSFLKISPFKYLAFDLEESISFEGDSGPYIQYTFARTQSILNEIKDNKSNTLLDELDTEKLNLSGQETALLHWIERFPEIV